MIGTQLAHYEITSHLGAGGMDDVYQATDTKLKREVAIKTLPEECDDNQQGNLVAPSRVFGSMHFDVFTTTVSPKLFKCRPCKPTLPMLLTRVRPGVGHRDRYTACATKPVASASRRSWAEL